MFTLKQSFLDNSLFGGKAQSFLTNEQSFFVCVVSRINQTCSMDSFLCSWEEEPWAVCQEEMGLLVLQEQSQAQICHMASGSFCLPATRTRPPEPCLDCWAQKPLHWTQTCFQCWRAYVVRSRSSDWRMPHLQRGRRMENGKCESCVVFDKQTLLPWWLKPHKFGCGNQLIVITSTMNMNNNTDKHVRFYSLLGCWR